MHVNDYNYSIRIITQDGKAKILTKTAVSYVDDIKKEFLNFYFCFQFTIAAIIAHSNATKIIIHFTDAKQECATAHKSGKFKGSVRVIKMKAFSTASRLGATIPPMAIQ